MIPEMDVGLLDEPLDERQEPSLTWKLDLTKGCISGRTDGMDAVRQAVFKVLQTNRFFYPIYNFDYGSELSQLIGMDKAFVESEAKRMISEALMTDDRIQGISNVSVSANGDEMVIAFRVETIFGIYDEEVTNTYV